MGEYIRWYCRVPRVISTDTTLIPSICNLCYVKPLVNKSNESSNENEVFQFGPGFFTWWKNADADSHNQLPLLIAQSESIKSLSKTSRPFSQYTNCTMQVDAKLEVDSNKNMVFPSVESIPSQCRKKNLRFMDTHKKVAYVVEILISLCQTIAVRSSSNSKIRLTRSPRVR